MGVVGGSERGGRRVGAQVGVLGIRWLGRHNGEEGEGKEEGEVEWESGRGEEGGGEVEEGKGEGGRWNKGRGRGIGGVGRCKKGRGNGEVEWVKEEKGEREKGNG